VSVRARRARRAVRASRPRCTRAAWVTAFAFALGATAPDARADELDRCVAAHAQSQRLRLGGQLLEAREQLLVCSAQACPSVIRAECGRGLDETKADLSSFVIAADDGAGHDVAGVKVSNDGAPAAEAFAGAAIEVDPGTRRFRFEAKGRPAVERVITVRQGEKNRIVSVPLPAADDAAVDAGPLESSRPVPIASIALGGVALLGAGGFAYFASSAKSDVEGLRARCQPICASSDVDPIRTKLIVANVSAGVGVAALAAAIWIFVTRPTERATTRVGVVPNDRGIAVQLARTF
jgi:hypothetical protein